VLNRSLTLFLLSVIALSACTPGSTPANPAPGDRTGAQPTSSGHTLVMATRVEVTSLSPLPFWQRRFTFLSTPRLFNASLTLFDDKGDTHPYLAESLPELNTDSWRVLPDGRMQTTYRLRPGLTWQDGTALSAEDFVFAWRLLTTPELGAATSQPQGLMERVSAPDAQTVVIEWRQLYPDAGSLADAFEPMPRHLLEQSFRESTAEGFLALPYWTRDYIGLGPYRVDGWEPGTFIEGGAFAGHALGKPNIDRIRLQFISDPNTVLANLLAGSVHIAIESSIRYQQALVLQNEWGPRGGGSAVLWPSIWRSIQVQVRPEYATPAILTDARARAAVAYALDRDAMNDAVLDGQGAVTDTMISPLMSYYADVERAVTKHPFDLRRSEQRMNELGYAKGNDGVFTRGGERLTIDLRVLAGAQQEVELPLLGSQLRTAGFDMQTSVIPPVQGQDGQYQATLPAFFAGGGSSGERSLPNYGSAAIPTAENRWTGRNYGGWSNAGYDALVDRFLSTLSRPERIQQIVQMAKIFSDELPAITYYFSPDGVAYVAGLTGPQVVVPDVATTWNVHEWKLQ
jgi:peptide/nickel transport system substrate-binding protein